MNQADEMLAQPLQVRDQSANFDHDNPQKQPTLNKQHMPSSHACQTGLKLGGQHGINHCAICSVDIKPNSYARHEKGKKHKKNLIAKQASTSQAQDAHSYRTTRVGHARLQSEFESLSIHSAAEQPPVHSDVSSNDVSNSYDKQDKPLAQEGASAAERNTPTHSAPAHHVTAPAVQSQCSICEQTFNSRHLRSHLDSQRHIEAARLARHGASLMLNLLACRTFPNNLTPPEIASQLELTQEQQAQVNTLIAFRSTLNTDAQQNMWDRYLLAIAESAKYLMPITTDPTWQVPRMTSELFTKVIDADEYNEDIDFAEEYADFTEENNNFEHNYDDYNNDNGDNGGGLSCVSSCILE